MNQPSNLRVALITGGAKRVGLAVTRRMAAAGWRVMIHANRSAEDAQKLAAELGNGATVVTADLTDEGATRRMVDEAAAIGGRLDAAVHCAAIWSAKSFEQITAADLRQNLAVNTVAAFVVAQQAGLVMSAQPEGGAIVLFGDAACERPQRGYAAYHPSKGAVPAMTRSLAVELAERNRRVRVNAVLPGPVLASENESEERRHHVATGTLLDTVGDAEHLAAAVQHFIENEFLTGECLTVDGGRSLAGGW